MSRHLKESTGKETINIDGREVKIKVVEPAFGLDRLFLAVLNDAYSELVEDGETKTIMKLNDKISPVQYCIFPLMKKDGLPEKALEIFNALKVRGFKVEYDDAGSIGKRYARADEVGISYCITIDYDSLEKNDFTIRYRDSREQKRIKIQEII
ncbi:Proline--tRNA ligase [uncultured archaeon]|nr:Proline--tRNA ligase [uncultured archaeon]